MKIKITEIEANAEELKNSNSLSSNLTNLLRCAFAPAARSYSSYSEEEDEEEDEDEDGVYARYGGVE